MDSLARGGDTSPMQFPALTSIPSSLALFFVFLTSSSSFLYVSSVYCFHHDGKRSATNVVMKRTVVRGVECYYFLVNK